MAEKRRMKSWMCVRKCQWGSNVESRKLYDVGAIVETHEQPCRHFVELQSGSVVDPVKVFRGKLDELGIVHDREWSLDRLQRELNIAEEILAKKGE